MSDNDKRLIEDFLPIESIGKEAAREKSTRKAHISTLHLWWARRPLVACRAAVYGALVPVSQFVEGIKPDDEARERSGNFIGELCKYPASDKATLTATSHILKAHATRLSLEMGRSVSVDDILNGIAPRPRVLDIFAGGGAIPLEALRLGCDAYAIELNPVAYAIELCTLVYPQKYGRPQLGLRGKSETGTWAGLLQELTYWGRFLLKELKTETAELYPLIPDPESKGRSGKVNKSFWVDEHPDRLPPGYLLPVAYLWTRTVKCKNPRCGAVVPLAKQAVVSKKSKGVIALQVIPNRKTKTVSYEVKEGNTIGAFAFDPSAGSHAGNATCPFCGTVADSDYVKGEGCARRLGEQLMVTVCSRSGTTGKVYLPANAAPNAVPDDELLQRKLERLCADSGVSVPAETIGTDAKSSCWTQLYGLTAFGDLFTTRQKLFLITFAAILKRIEAQLLQEGYSEEYVAVILTYFGLLLSRSASFGNGLCAWNAHETAVSNVFARQAIPMVWDFAEVQPFGNISGSIVGGFQRLLDVVEATSSIANPAEVHRASATSATFDGVTFDCVITDPPYYDNVPYSILSDFFYVWLKRVIGRFYPEHFASDLTPKKQEVVADALRHDGDQRKARQAYEWGMTSAFARAATLLKDNSPLVVVYAHKTTMGWATLVDSLRQSGFTITEAWPLDTEFSGGLRNQERASLASSIFLVCRKRKGQEVGFETEVRADLQKIVGERVVALWQQGISGADLVIACVGAGLRAFTKFTKVEYPNGEEVPAERFLAEVETVVLDAILAKLSKAVGADNGRYSLAGVDAATRFYILWRYTYRSAQLDAGETIVFANGTHVELEGLHGLSSGGKALVEKKKGGYRLLDYSDRGGDSKLGITSDDGQPAPMVDILHRLLWLMERHPSGIPQFLREVRPNMDQLRLVAQALAGPALKGGELGEVASGSELAALTKLTANWRSVVEDSGAGPLFSLTDDTAR